MPFAFFIKMRKIIISEKQIYLAQSPHRYPLYLVLGITIPIHGSWVAGG